MRNPTTASLPLFLTGLVLVFSCSAASARADRIGKLVAGIEALNAKAPVISCQEAPRGHDASIFHDFCDSPYIAVCGSLPTHDDARHLRIMAFKQGVRSQALAATARHFGVSPKRFDERALARLAETQSGVRAVYFSALYAAIAAKVHDRESRSVLRFGNTIRNFLKAAVRAEAPEHAAYLEKALDETVVVTSLLLKKLEGHEEMRTSGLLDKLESEIASNCGTDGLNDNAFASTVEGVRYVHICPGALLSGIGTKPTEANHFLNILFLLGHEFAHQIDTGNFPEVYPTFVGCMLKNHTTPLGSPADSSEGEKLGTHLREITADYWAVRAMSRYFNSFQPPLARGQVLDAFRQSWGTLCESKDDHHHPSGKYRIEVLLRREATLHALFGCSKSGASGIKGCSLSGESNAPLH